MCWPHSPAELLYVRRRDNAFDEHTANEARAQALLIATTCIMEGLLLFMWTGNIHSATSAQWVLNAAGCLIGLAAAYYVFQLAACATLGYVFTDPLSASLWRRGLNASTTALGIAPDRANPLGAVLSGTYVKNADYRGRPLHFVANMLHFKGI